MIQKYLKITNIVVFFIFILIFINSCSSSSIEKKDNLRVVSLAPSITEIFIYLNKPENLVGITRFSKNFKQLSNVEIVGGIVDFSIEKIISLKPDIILYTPAQESRVNKITGIKKLKIEQNSIDNIIRSINIVSKLLNINDTNNTIEYKKFLSTIKNKYKNTKRKKGLVVVYLSSLNKDNISFYVAGKRTYYNDILTLFNIENVCDSSLSYYKLSLEDIIKLNPEIIFDFSIGDSLKNVKPLFKLKKNVNLISIKTQYASIPGPISVKKLIEEIDVKLKKNELVSSK